MPGSRNRPICRIGIMFASLLICLSAGAEDQQEIVLKNPFWTVAIQPSSLRVCARPNGRTEFELSVAQADLGPASNVEHTGERIQWQLPEESVTVSMRLDQSDLAVRIRSGKPGSFTWPVIRQAKSLKGLIWPRWEGCYIPLKDSKWVDYLIGAGGWNTLEGLSMPFWGLDCGDYILTYIATNRYNNEIRFSKADGEFGARFSHEFPTNHAEKEYGFVIRLSENTSPVEPAKVFREWLIDRGELVSMQDKMKKIPIVERLLGAAHVYLWGDGLLTRHDIHRKQWQPFCRKLVEQGEADGPSVGKRIKELMHPEQWAQVVEITTLQWPYNYIKSEVANGLCRLLERPDFYDEASWRGIALPEDAIRLLRPDRSTLSVPELCRMNSLLLRAAYPEAMLEVADWGDGVSTKMLKQLKQAGFDRMRLCVDGWLGIEKRPEVAVQADKTGYLFGTYDSFHSIHDPALRGTDATWETAQFDQELYENGPIVGKDGKKKRGFKGAGYKLSPIAARPYVEKRVNENMKNIPFNYYFVDCDAYGEVYDDYSPLHPATQAEDVAARNDRLAWIGDTHQVVIGSEGGSSYAAPVIHVAEGMFGPAFGWGDPDLRDRDSEYYLGGYYPPDGPRVFLQQVPLKQEYECLFYDPRFRLPLYEVVFHDSVVSTHQWANGSLKFTTVLDTVALMELLYMVPPLYHLNLDELQKHRETMKKHYGFFSPLHRELGFLQMTDFAWLSPDRLAHRTVFGDRVEMVANFADQEFEYQGTVIPARSILARWLDSGKAEVFTPDVSRNVRRVRVESSTTANETEGKMKMLEDLRWKPKWTSLLGCMKGCLDYLDIGVSDAWLFGATGHAFVINIHEVVCPSGPTAWNQKPVYILGKNIGYTAESVFAHKSESSFAEAQKTAWETVKQAIDAGLPCFGWELDIPESYVIYGYDDTGYYYSGPQCDSGKGPKPWRELGDTGIGVVSVSVVKRSKAADDRTTVKEALQFALEHSKNPEKWIFPKYKAGLAGYDLWIKALETEKADGFGMAYNAAVWNECRQYAVQFLKEAKERIGDESLNPLFDEAIGHYEVVARNLKKVADAFPFHGMEPEHIKDEARRRTAIEALTAARDAEESGLKALEKLAAEL